MRPAALTEGSFAKALGLLLSQVEKWQGITSELYMPEDLPPLLPEQETALFRLVQEAATNAVRHGRCKSLEVKVAVHPQALELVVQDDGQGCEEIVAGHGLTGMSERIRELGGQLAFHTRPGQGFNVTATLPLGGERPEQDKSNDR